MALNQRQQVYELIEKHNNILILLPFIISGDAIGAGLSLSSALKKLSKNVTVVCGGQIPNQYNFLSGIDVIQKDITGTRDLVISVNTKEYPISELHYDEEGEFLNIYLTPGGEGLDPRSIEVKQGTFQYNLLIVLHCSDLEELGPLYEKNTELFFDVPIVNIDHHPSNEQFGEVNLVEITAASTSEIVYYLIEEWGKDLLDDRNATQLLTGIISSTNSFRRNNTTPRSFSVAAALIGKKANHQEIVRYLYKTKPLEILHLWGRMMARLKHDKEHKILWSLISKEDFAVTNTTPQSLARTLDELVLNVPYDTNAIMILYQSPEESFTENPPDGRTLRGVIQWLSRDKGKQDKLSSLLSGVVKNSRIHFTLEGDNLNEAEEIAVSKTKNVIETG